MEANDWPILILYPNSCFQKVGAERQISEAAPFSVCIPELTTVPDSKLNPLLRMRNSLNIKGVMTNSTPLNIGMYEFGGVVTKCAVNLAELSPTKNCPDIGVSSEILGNALAIAKVPYQLVSVEEYADNFGALDETTGRWSGTHALMHACVYHTYYPFPSLQVCLVCCRMEPLTHLPTVFGISPRNESNISNSPIL